MELIIIRRSKAKKIRGFCLQKHVTYTHRPSASLSTVQEHLTHAFIQRALQTDRPWALQSTSKSPRCLLPLVISRLNPCGALAKQPLVTLQNKDRMMRVLPSARRTGSRNSPKARLNLSAIKSILFFFPSKLHQEATAPTDLEACSYPSPTTGCTAWWHYIPAAVLLRENIFILFF